MTEENTGSMPEMEMEGKGTARDINNSPKDGIEYDGGSTNPMEDLAAEIDPATQKQLDDATRVIEESLSHTLGEDVKVDVTISKASNKDSEVPDPNSPRPEAIPAEPGMETESVPEPDVEEAVSNEAVEAAVNDEIPPSIDPETVIESPELIEANGPTFNPNDTKDARGSGDSEGGVVASRSTGPTMSIAKDTSKVSANSLGRQVKEKSNLDEDSKVNLFEVFGFSVQYQIDEAVHSIQVRDYFEDVDTAFSSVNSDKYLIPMPGGGYKVGTITAGSPTICYNERQLYMYKDEKWVRT